MMKIFFAILSVILLFGMIGDREKENRRNFTYGFISTVVAIVALHMIA